MGWMQRELTKLAASYGYAFRDLGYSLQVNPITKDEGVIAILDHPVWGRHSVPSCRPAPAKNEYVDQEDHLKCSLNILIACAKNRPAERPAPKLKAQVSHA